MYTTHISPSQQRLLKIPLIFIILYISKLISAIIKSINVGNSLIQKPQFLGSKFLYLSFNKKPFIIRLKHGKLTGFKKF